MRKKSINTSSSIRAQRVCQKKTYEVKSINHGAGKSVKVSFETTSESFEQYHSDSAVNCAALTDYQDILKFINNSKKDSGKQLYVEPILNEGEEYVDYEEIPQMTLPKKPTCPGKVESGLIPRNDPQGIKGVPVSNNDEEKAENYTIAEPDEDIKSISFRKAKELLDIAVPIRKSNKDIVEFHLVSETYKDEGNYIREYIANPPFNGKIDFTKFANPEEFERSINLKGKTLIECIVEYVKTKVIKYPSIKCHYQAVIGYIMLIEKKWGITLMPVVIGNMFWTQFEGFLYNNDLAPRTAVNICLHLRAVIKWASMYGATLSVDFDDFEFKAVDCKPKVTLTEDEISRIRWFDLSKIDCRADHRKMLEVVRDHFILSCYLGQRFSDTIRIDETNFLGASKETFRIIQKKTGNKAVLDFNKIFPEYPAYAREILEKYEYKSPYKGDICNYNRWLHELSRIIGLDDEIKYEYKVNGKIITKSYKKWELISSHTARRTFITQAVKRSVNTQYIKRASGHKSDSSFGKYVLFEDV